MTAKGTLIDRRVEIGGQLVPWDDAPHDVVLERKLIDILKATPGNPQLCMNSMCISAQRNAHVFPHPVYAVQTTKLRVYVVDSITVDDTNADVSFNHAFRYELYEKDSKLIHAHDASGAGEPGELRLRVPRELKGHQKRGGPGITDPEAREEYNKIRVARRSQRKSTLRGRKQRYVTAVGAALRMEEATRPNKPTE